MREGGTCAIPSPECPLIFDFDRHHSDPWAFTVHHVIPRSLGGANEDPANMVPAHRRCNEIRSNKMTPQIVWEDYESELRLD